MAVSHSPAYPLAGEAVTVSQTVDVGGEDVAIAAPSLVLVSVPSGSALTVGLVVDVAGNPTATLTPDVAGEYELSITGFVETTAPPAYEDDGPSDPTATVLDTEALTISVGVEMSLPIATLAGHNLTLTIGTFDGVVRTATLTAPTSPKAAAAALDTGVAAKLALLLGEDTSSVGPDLVAGVANLIAKYNGHRTQATVHTAPDATNVYSPDRPYDISNAVLQLNALRATLQKHLTGASTASARWHDPDDTRYYPIVAPASGLAAATVLYADLWRVYEGHRVLVASPSAHDNADAVNTLGTADPLTAFLVTLLTYLADETPTLPAGVEDGMIQLQSLYGFEAA